MVKLSNIKICLVVCLLMVMSSSCEAQLKFTSSKAYKLSTFQEFDNPGEILTRMYVEQVLIRRLEEFHDALKSKDYEKLMKLGSETKSNFRSVIHHANRTKDFSFDCEYFTDEYRINDVELYLLGVSSPEICVYASRRAIVDGKFREFFSIRIVFENDEWVFAHYYLPDFVNYIYDVSK